MPTDRSMPPADAMPVAESNPAGGVSPDAMPSGADSQTVSMPKAAFETLHTLITELAKGVDALAQAMGSAPAESTPPEAAAPTAPAAAGGQSDEDFLKSIASEGTNR